MAFSAREPSAGSEVAGASPRGIRHPRILLCAVAFAGILLSIGVAEAVLRLFIPLPDDAGPGKRGDDPILVFGFPPGSPYFEETLSSKGFRERDLPDRPAPGAFRIAAVGDSFTFGLGVPREAAWPQQLQARLVNGDARIEVLNFGVPGYNACQEDRLVETVVLSMRPHLVVLQLLDNDGERLKWNPPICGQCLPSATRMDRVVEWLVHETRTGRLFADAWRSWRFDPRRAGGGPSGPEAYLHDPSGLYRRSLEASVTRLVERTRATGANVAVVLFPEPDTYHKPWTREPFKHLCERLDVPFLDLHDAIPERALPGIRASDGTHLGPEGNRRAAEAIERFLGERRLLPPVGGAALAS